MNLEELRCNAYYDFAEHMSEREKQLGIKTAEEYRERMRKVDPTFDDNYMTVKTVKEDCDLSLGSLVTIAEALECTLEIKLIPKKLKWFLTDE